MIANTVYIWIHIQQFPGLVQTRHEKQKLRNDLTPTICCAVVKATFPHTMCLNPTECDSCSLISCLLSALSLFRFSYHLPLTDGGCILSHKKRKCGRFNVVHSSPASFHLRGRADTSKEIKGFQRRWSLAAIRHTCEIMTWQHEIPHSLTPCWRGIKRRLHRGFFSVRWQDVHWWAEH